MKTTPTADMLPDLEAAPRLSWGPPREPAAPRGVLTCRELEVVRLVASGLRNKEIAWELHLSEQTVKNHLSRIFTVLGVRDRLALTLHAQRAGMVPLPSPAAEVAAA
jgi:DNA-binding NarL/FixJ family response regulator